MKKIFLTSVVAAALVFGIPVSAQQTDGSTGATKTEQTDKAAKKEGKRKAGPRKGHFRADAFEGITLTDAQKASLDALKPQCPQARECQKTEKNDSTCCRNNPKQAKADYVKAVKDILTPEQYVVFLENIVVNDAFVPGNRPMSRDMQKARMHKDAKKAHKKMEKDAKRKSPKGGEQQQ